MLIIFKCKFSNAVPLKLTQCCSSMLLQKETNKLFEKDIRFVVTRDSVGGMGNWVKVAKRLILPV